MEPSANYRRALGARRYGTVAVEELATLEKVGFQYQSLRQLFSELILRPERALPITAFCRRWQPSVARQLA
jgi:hypothetical protein